MLRKGLCQRSLQAMFCHSITKRIRSTRSQVSLPAHLRAMAGCFKSRVAFGPLPHPIQCRAMTFTEPGALCQSELQVEGAMTFSGAPCEAGRDGASGMALHLQRSLTHSLTHSGRFRVGYKAGSGLTSTAMNGIRRRPETRHPRKSQEHWDLG